MEVSCDGEQNKAKQNKDLTSLKMVANFVCLVPVRLLLSSMEVLYHVNGWLQRAFFSLYPVTLPEAFAKVNWIQFPSSKVADGRIFCFCAYEERHGGI